MARNKGKITRMEIIQCATQLFMEQGYCATTAHQIAEKLQIATGNMTYYFPTKEHLLAVLVDMLCDYQWKRMEQEANDGVDSVMAICLELTAMAAMCEADAVAREFYLAAYSSPLCLAIIRRHDTQRNMAVFQSFCPDWGEDQFRVAERIASGAEFGMLMDAGEPISLQTRISGGIDAVLKLYDVPQQQRWSYIRRVLAMDYLAVGKRVLAGFKQYVAHSNEQALEQMYKTRVNMKG